MKLLWPQSISYSISRKIILSLLLISGAITTVTTTMQLGFDYYIDIQKLKDDLARIELGYKNSVANSLWELNRPQLRAELEGIVSSADIVYAEVLDSNESIVSFGHKPLSEYINNSFDLEFNNAGRKYPLGKLNVYASKQNIKSRIWKKVFVVFAIHFLNALGITTLFYFAIQSIVTRHITSINDFVKRFNLNSGTKKLILHRKIQPLFENQKDELDILAGNINNLHEKLETAYNEQKLMNSLLEEKVFAKTQEILQQRQQLEFSAKMSALGEMAGGIAHEINTPLATMSAAVQIILKKIDTEADLDKESLAKSLQRSQTTVSKIAQIVKGLLTFSRDGGRDPFETVLVRSLVTETILLCQQKIINNKIRLSADEVPENLVIECQFVQAGQVLLNLINNAFDAAENSSEKWIRIEAYENDRFSCISVIDSGHGISGELTSKMFQPFFTTKELGKGTGLGLSISQSIMIQHKGRLDYSIKDGHTCFTMVFPKKVS